MAAQCVARWAQGWLYHVLYGEASKTFPDPQMGCRSDWHSKWVIEVDWLRFHELGKLCAEDSRRRWLLGHLWDCRRTGTQRVEEIITQLVT